MDEDKKKDETTSKDTMYSSNSQDKKMCTECGSSMHKKDGNWVCENCKHEMLIE